MLSLLIGGALIAWACAGRDFLRGNSLLAGAGVGAAVVAMWWITGHWGYLTEHPETLQETYLATNSGRAEALSFVAPIAYTLDWLMFYSDRTSCSPGHRVGVWRHRRFDPMAVSSRRFRWEGFGGTEDLAHHLVGAVLMGVGGVTAMGCSIGQGVSGVSTLSATSFVAVFAMIAGAVAALNYQSWRFERMA